MTKIFKEKLDLKNDRKNSRQKKDSENTLNIFGDFKSY